MPPLAADFLTRLLRALCLYDRISFASSMRRRCRIERWPVASVSLSGER